MLSSSTGSGDVCNNEQQGEELAVLDSIYGTEITSNKYVYDTRILEMQINPQVKLRITLTERYPVTEGPMFEILGRNVSEAERSEVLEKLNSVYVGGEVVLFDCIELCKEFFSSRMKCNAENTDNSRDSERDPSPSTNFGIQVNAITPPNFLNGIPIEKLEKEIYHGEPITDRKSVFQAHVSSVHTKDDVASVINQLLMDKKIQRAHHPCMYAYRIRQKLCDSKGSVLLADNDDDGENGAGTKLAGLLDLLDVIDVVVVVTRWYGGILLGPDRFKHIANAARIALTECGFVSADGERCDSLKRNKKSRHMSNNQR